MRGTRVWFAIAMLTALFATSVVAGCGDDEDGATTEESSDGTGNGAAAALDTVEEGTLTVGTDAPYAPFEVGNPKDPDFAGYDIEVMNAIGEQLGLEVAYVDTGFGTIFRDTANGQFDTAAAASDIDAKREQVVDFTDPYYLSSTALVVPEDSDIASVEDLSGAIVGAQDGTSQQEYAENETEASDVRGFPEGPNAISAMITGQVEAVLTDQATGVLAVEENDGIEIVEEITTDVFFGFAVAPDNDGLREAMNEALATLKEDGTITDLYAKYFDGAEPPAAVLDGTNELLTND